jgi:hypothetical protein
VDIVRLTARREYLLRVSLLKGDAVLATRTLVLKRPFAWQILGPIPFYHIAVAGPIDARTELPAQVEEYGKVSTWQSFDDEHVNALGILDFGRFYAGTTYDAPGDRMVYAATDIHVPADGDYLVKLQGDDDVILWIDGQEVGRIVERGPPIRTAREFRTQLGKGHHQVLVRLGQQTGQWQLGLRFRDLEQGVVGIEGRAVKLPNSASGPSAEAGVSR